MFWSFWHLQCFAKIRRGKKTVEIATQKRMRVLENREKHYSQKSASFGRQFNRINHQFKIEMNEKKN